MALYNLIEKKRKEKRKKIKIFDYGIRIRTIEFS